MKTYILPPKNEWKNLTRRATLQQQDLSSLVKNIFADVQQGGDAALKRYTQTFDKVSLNNLRIQQATVTDAVKTIDPALKDAILLAYKNIKKFHESQKEAVRKIETSIGVQCWRESRPIESVGIYIPGGTAPLFSTVLMLGVPAQIAGCSEIVLCTPPSDDGLVHPAILFAAQLVGVTHIFSVGGIQAIAAMTVGTESIPVVSKIFGPGNQYVTAAKQEALQWGVAIDMPAGPSEVLVIADDTAVPDFVAADLLSQAEHGQDSQVILLSTSQSLIEKTLQSVAEQLDMLPRKSFAQKALDNSVAILLENIDDCFSFSNLYAPEHLIVATKNAENDTYKITNAGSVFLGNYSCESAGDYVSGTNHTLPTNGYAKNYSGVSLDSFVKKITFQKIEKEGLQNIATAITCMAAEEQLLAHKNAVTIRLK